VGVGWNAQCCGTCFACASQFPAHCENGRITGVHVDGGYAEFTIAHQNVLVRIPDELEPVDAAPILCGGVTAFTALKKSGATAGDIVVIQGFGGLGFMALQFANKMGLYPVVVTRGEEKKNLALRYGAKIAVDTTDEKAGDLISEIQKLGGADVILGTAPSAKAVEKIIPALKFNGTVVLLAFVHEPVQLDTLQLMAKNVNIKIFGSSSSPKDIQDTLKFVVDQHISTRTETFDIKDAQKAFDSTFSGHPKFRNVLNLAKRTPKPKPQQVKLKKEEDDDR